MDTCEIKFDFTSITRILVRRVIMWICCYDFLRKMFSQMFSQITRKYLPVDKLKTKGHKVYAD